MHIIDFYLFVLLESNKAWRSLGPQSRKKEKGGTPHEQG